MGAFAVPVPADKVEAWRAFAAELAGPKAGDFANFNFRHGLTHHRLYVQQVLGGTWMTVMTFEGPGVDAYLADVGASEHWFDVWFRTQLRELHGLDLAAGPLAVAELAVDGVYDFLST